MGAKGLRLLSLFCLQDTMYVLIIMVLVPSPYILQLIRNLPNLLKQPNQSNQSRLPRPMAPCWRRRERRAGRQDCCTDPVIAHKFRGH